MIKKTTNAVFTNGGYKGEYDWEGGIPLSEGEKVVVTLASGETLTYVLEVKRVNLQDLGENQNVHIDYLFSLSS